MDILSIAGFALNVVSYLKENPLAADASEPIAVEQVAESGAIIPDLTPMTVAQAKPAGELTKEKVYLKPSKPRNHSGKVSDGGGEPPLSKKVPKKKTTIGEDGQIRMASDSSGQADRGLKPLYSRDKQNAPPSVESGINKSGQYFFRKREL